MFKVDYNKCHDIGSSLALMSMRNDAFLNIAPRLDNKITQSLIFLYAAGICHQTETLEGRINGHFYRGWNYLITKFIEQERINPNSLSPILIKELTTDELKSILSDSGDPNHSTLSRAEERANFLRNLAEKLIENYSSNPILIYGDGMLGGDNGLYARMKCFKAFGEDSIMKKATVYFMLMRKSDSWPSFIDPHELMHMPDYHKERLFLRTGCIKVTDREVDAALQNKSPQDIAVDNELRTATSEAYKEILKYSEKDFFELEILLWSFARSLCYHNMMCTSNIEDQGNFHEIALVEKMNICPLQRVCERKHNYWQPIVDTNFH